MTDQSITSLTFVSGVTNPGDGIPDQPHLADCFNSQREGEKEPHVDYLFQQQWKSPDPDPPMYLLNSYSNHFFLFIHYS